MIKDITIIVLMIMMMMSYSAYGVESVDPKYEDSSIELNSGRGLDFSKEIEKQEGQFRVVARSLTHEEAEEKDTLISESDPLTISLIKTR